MYHNILTGILTISYGYLRYYPIIDNDKEFILISYLLYYIIKLILFDSQDDSNNNFNYEYEKNQKETKKNILTDKISYNDINKFSENDIIIYSEDNDLKSCEYQDNSYNNISNNFNYEENLKEIKVNISTFLN